MSIDVKNEYEKNVWASFGPAISFIVVPLGFIFEFIIEAPFLILLTMDKVFGKKK